MHGFGLDARGRSQVTLTLPRPDEPVGAAPPATSPEATALREHLRALRGLGDALARPLDLLELFRATRRETSRALGAQTFFLGLYDTESQTVEIVRQFDSGVELAGGIFPLGSGLTSQVIRTRQSQLICRWSREGPPVQLQYATDTPGLPESAITAPLLIGDRVLGVISTYSY